MGSELKIFREHLRRHNMRFTPEREVILKEVFSRHDHFTVDDLYLALREKHRISRASLYRTIPLLIAAGLLTEVFQQNGQASYEHIYGHEHHCHLRCLECGEIVEFAEPYLNRLEQRLAREHQYQISGHHLEVRGLCPACQARQAPGGGERP